MIGIIEFVNYWPKKIKFEADLNAGCWNGPFAVLFWDELLLIPKSPSHENFATRLIDGHRWANRCSICDGVYHACHDIFLKPYIYWKCIRVNCISKWKHWNGKTIVMKWVIIENKFSQGMLLLRQKISKDHSNFF